jgi:hypothetical protein
MTRFVSSPEYISLRTGCQECGNFVAMWAGKFNIFVRAAYMKKIN